jgi:predicted Holliday junction resolvase-like endonuclease
MKKLGLFLAFAVITFSGIAQKTSEYNEGRFERSKVYAEVAAKEFNLTEVQQKELYEKKVEHYAESYEANQKFNKGEITKEEKKIPNQKFGKYFNQLTGKNYQQLKPFYEKVKKELDKL